jgi:ABC-type Fe3+-hydroxamate transport system substrate-binding protein
LEVVVTDPSTVATAIEMIRDLGLRLDRPEKADELLYAIDEALLARPAAQPRRIAVIVWRKPLMVLGSDTYGNDLLTLCGAENVFADEERYPVTEIAALRARAPALILMPDEPFPFTEKHLPEFAGIAPAVIVDGKALWWYGPRMPAAIHSLHRLFPTTERQ